MKRATFVSAVLCMCVVDDGSCLYDTCTGRVARRPLRRGKGGGRVFFTFHIEFSSKSFCNSQNGVFMQPIPYYGLSGDTGSCVCCATVSSSCSSRVCGALSRCSGEGREYRHTASLSSRDADPGGVCCCVFVVIAAAHHQEGKSRERRVEGGIDCSPGYCYLLPVQLARSLASRHTPWLPCAGGTLSTRERLWAGLYLRSCSSHHQLHLSTTRSTSGCKLGSRHASQCSTSSEGMMPVPPWNFCYGY